MEETKKKEEKTSKLSYDQLEAVANQLSQQNQQLAMRLRNIDNVFKRLDYLFAVVNAEVFKGTEFQKTCAKEIEEILTPEEETKEEEKK